MGFVLKPILLVFFSNDFPKWKLFKAKKNSQKKNHLVISLFFSNWKYRTCIARQQAVINAGQIPKLLSIHARKVHWVDKDSEAAFFFFLLMRWEYHETFFGITQTVELSIQKHSYSHFWKFVCIRLSTNCRNHTLTICVISDILFKQNISK